VNGQQSFGVAKASQPAYFDSLLEKGKKRAHAADGGPAFGDLPTLQLGLDDIARRARELGGLGSQDRGPSTDGKASDQR
jgi:nuclear pore complex protein Nup93